MEELDERYGVDRSYLGKTLRLAALAPGVVRPVLAGDDPRGP